MPLKFPEPWRIESRCILDGDDTTVLWVNQLGGFELAPEAEQLILAAPQMRRLLADLTENPVGPARREAMQLLLKLGTYR